MMLADEAATIGAGLLLAGALRIGDVVALSGELGAGKSTLARGILRGLGHEGDVPSPTFGLVIPYEPPGLRIPAWHADLYRIDQPEEAEALALDEALEDGVLLVEWPERLGPRLWPEALRITLSHDPSGGRRLTVSVPPSWEGRCPLS
jgi:tRNA threonylcarbamoyladenosine biosynthesis protein TsaE